MKSKQNFQIVIMKNYRPGWTQFFLTTLLFMLGHTSGYATNQPAEPGLTLLDPAPKEVIYLAQSSSGEQPEEEIIEEEEEEPDCD